MSNQEKNDMSGGIQDNEKPFESNSTLTSDQIEKCKRLHNEDGEDFHEENLEND